MQNTESNSLHGTWWLVSAEVHDEAGDITYPWGPQPVGYLVYTEAGTMFGSIMNAGRPHFATEDIQGASREELVQAMRTYFSYCGSYEVRGKQIIHHVKMSLLPNWTGEDEIRFIEQLTTDQLVLKTPPLLVAGTKGAMYIFWRRV